MFLSSELRERVDQVAIRLRNIATQFGGDSDDWPGEARETRHRLQELLLVDQPQGEYCYAVQIPYAVEKYGREAFSLPFFMSPRDDRYGLLEGCRDDLLWIGVSGKSDEVVNLVKQYDGFGQLGERFRTLRKSCSLENGQPWRHEKSSDPVTNPFRAYTCIMISEYFCEQLSQGTPNIGDDVCNQEIDFDPEGNNYRDNQYRDNQQRVAHDLSIAETAILASDILYYISLFV